MTSIPFSINALLSSAATDGSPTPTVKQLQAAMPLQKDTGWILEYLVFTMNPEEQDARAAFESQFQLTSTEKQALVSIAKRRSDGERTVRGRSTPAIATALNAEAERDLRAIAGNRYDAMVTWLRQWYSQNAAMRTHQQMDLIKTQKQALQQTNIVARLFGQQAAASDYSSIYVYQTQFGSSGWDGALPDYALKYATLYGCCVSPPYSIQPYWFGATYNGITFSQIYTKEVGPWNEDDNYWDFTNSPVNPRRCSPAPGSSWDGIPESELAMWYGFNGGLSCYLSQSGVYQTVLNVAGVDLEPDVASAFGLCRYYCNSWMTVTYTRNP